MSGINFIILVLMFGILLFLIYFTFIRKKQTANKIEDEGMKETASFPTVDNFKKPIVSGNEIYQRNASNRRSLQAGASRDNRSSTDDSSNTLLTAAAIYAMSSNNSSASSDMRDCDSSSSSSGSYSSDSSSCSSSDSGGGGGD